MKKTLLFSLAIFCSLLTFAQNGINYSAQIKDANGAFLANQNITLQFNIQQTTTNITIFTENHLVTTDDNGIAIAVIGAGTVVNGDYSAIPWELDTYALNVQVNTGSGFVDLGTSDFKEVPYAIVANELRDPIFKRQGNVITAAEESDFLIGSSTIDYDGSGDTDHKLFYNVFTNAFRAGGVDGNHWDFGEIGISSTATGYNTRASGLNSVAMGSNNTASGENSVAFGAGNVLSGINSFATGLRNMSSDNNTHLLGQDLESEAAHQTIFGKYNAPTTSAVFQIGDGANEASRNTLFSIENDGAIISNFYEGTGERNVVADADGKLIIGAGSSSTNGLEIITEDGNEGFRLAGSYPLAYGDIGFRAVDLSSASGGASSLKGATGDYSFAAGLNTIASANSSASLGFENEATGVASIALGYRTVANAVGTVAVGTYNIGGGVGTTFNQNNPIFEVGNGVTPNGRSNALTILQNGTVTAPSLDISEITDDKALITKEYLETNGSSGLNAIDEGNGIGYRLKNSTGAEYQNVGVNAIDLTTNVFSGVSVGASGENSFAVGSNSLASALSSYSMGTQARATGSLSIAIGAQTRATANETLAIGRMALASADRGTAVGYSSRATGLFATALGFDANATGEFSMAFGPTTASGTYTSAFGEGSIAQASNSTVLGRFNEGGGNPTSWVSTDPLFEIGNGINASDRNNAFTVLKNGNIGIGKHSNIEGMLEIEGNSSSNRPQLSLVEDNSSGFARMRFKNKNSELPNFWDIATISGMDAFAENRMNFFYSGIGNILSLRGDGDVFINGSLAHSSDRRLKSDIENIDYGIAEILKLNPVQYHWKNKADKPFKSLGVIAQEIQEIIPNVVQIGDDEEQTLSVSYTELIPVLIKAIQEQQEIINAQNDKYASLEKMVLELVAQAKMDGTIYNDNNVSVEKE